MIVGITGFKRSGKDTVAAVLVEKYGYTRVALADPLKEMALAVDPYVVTEDDDGNRDWFRLSTIVNAGGWEQAKEHEDVRRFLQRLGSEGVRDTLGPDAWILRLRRTLTDTSSLEAAHHATVPQGLKVVVPDVRFPNEADAIREMGGQVWKVVRPGHWGDGHQSELGVADIEPNFEILNNGTVEDLHERVVFILEPAMPHNQT